MELSKTRFLFDGERIQSELTLFENQLEDNSIVEVFEELVGGKGPSEDQIRQMIDNCESDSSEEIEASESDSSEEVKATENLHPHAFDSEGYK